jgi:hypothetical protein
VPSYYRVNHYCRLFGCSIAFVITSIILLLIGWQLATMLFGYLRYLKFNYRLIMLNVWLVLAPIAISLIVPTIRCPQATEEVLYA